MQATEGAGSPQSLGIPTEFALYAPSGNVNCAEHVGNQPWMTMD